MKKLRKLFLLIFIVLVSVATVFWLTYQPSVKTSVIKVKEEKNKDLEILLSKLEPYHGIYNSVYSHTHSAASGKAMVSYLDALHEGDTVKLKDYLPVETLVNEEKRLLSFYQALDYNTLKVGKVIPHKKTNITDIQLIFSVNGIEISKTLNMYQENKKEFHFYETSEMQMDSKSFTNNDPVLSAIVAQFGKGMDYQPAIPGIIDFSKEGADKHFAYNYPLLLSLTTVKKIDKLRYDEPYFRIEFENIALLISRTKNEVQAELNHSELYQLQGGKKEIKAIQDYAAPFLRP